MWMCSRYSRPAALLLHSGLFPFCLVVLDVYVRECVSQCVCILRQFGVCGGRAVCS